MRRCRAGGSCRILRAPAYELRHRLKQWWNVLGKRCFVVVYAGSARAQSHHEWRRSWTQVLGILAHALCLHSGVVAVLITLRRHIVDISSGPVYSSCRDLRLAVGYLRDGHSRRLRLAVRYFGYRITSWCLRLTVRYLCHWQTRRCLWLASRHLSGHTCCAWRRGPSSKVEDAIAEVEARGIEVEVIRNGLVETTASVGVSWSSKLT